MTNVFRLPGQQCPTCRGQELLLEETIENDDAFGDLLLSTLRCESCGYKNTDVIFLRERTPIAIQVRIESLNDLKSKVARSGSATIRIPELGIRITPGYSSDGFVSNAEGVLERIEQVLEVMITALSGKRKRKAAIVLKNLKSAREGKKKLTIELKDPSGNSEILPADPSKLKKRKLTKRELDTLRRYR